MPSQDQSDSLAVSSPFPLLERWYSEENLSEERYSAVQQDQLHIVSDSCIADTTWEKKKKKIKKKV